MYTFKDVEMISKKILNDEIMAIPTDTVYGLMAIAKRDNEENLNRLKASPADKKISLIFKDVDTLIEAIDTTKTYNIELIKKYLPGKYTFIVNLKESAIIKKFYRTDFGVRVTTNQSLQQLISKTGTLLATSCNKSGQDICMNKEQIKKEFPSIDIVIEDTIQTKESSAIIDLTKKEPIMLR